MCQMETCIINYIYFNTITRSIISELHTCRQKSAGKGQPEEYLKEVKDIVEVLKGDLSVMVEVSKRERDQLGRT